MEFDVTFDGLDDLLRDIRGLPDEAEHQLEVAIKETTAEAFRLIVGDTPGGAKRLWDQTFPAKLSGEVTTAAPLNWFLEWGTGLYGQAADGKHAKYEIKPKYKKALSFQGHGGSPYQLRGQDGPFAEGTSFNERGRAFDPKGRAIFRSKAGNATIDPKRAGSMVVVRSVMHPGIKPVAMVRGNLPAIRAIFEARVNEAWDRSAEWFTRG